MTSMRSSFSFFLDCTICIWNIISFIEIEMYCTIFNELYFLCFAYRTNNIRRNEWTNANNWRHPYIWLSHNKCIHFITKGVTQCLCMHSVSNINVDAFKMESVRNDIMPCDILKLQSIMITHLTTSPSKLYHFNHSNERKKEIERQRKREGRGG